MRPVSPPADSPASRPRARSSSRRIDGGRGREPGVRLSEALDALLDLRRRDAGVGQAQARLSAVEHEVAALDELDAALGSGGEQGIDARAAWQLDPEEVAALRSDETGVGKLASQG